MTETITTSSNSSYILGISCYYHDSSATIIKDGNVVAAAEEERFTRKKHDNDFPINAINYCLSTQNITMKEITCVAFYEKPMLKFERVLIQHIDGYPKSIKTFVTSMPHWITHKLKIRKRLKKLGFDKEVYYIRHHLAHAASAFYPSPFKEAVILTNDGVGEWDTLTYGYANEGEISLDKKLIFPSSLGLLYSTITAYLGFKVNNSEYKVMGLAAYGQKSQYYDRLKSLIDIKEDGSFMLDMSYFKYHYSDKMPSKKLCELLGGPVRKNEEIDQRHMNIAKALQMVIEDIIIKIINCIYPQYNSENLVMAGGVALNSVCNGKILRNTKFKNIWIQPNSSDGGTSMGAGLFVNNQILKLGRRYRMENAYLGPEYSAEAIKAFLIQNNITYEECHNIPETTAKMIYDNKVVGWFQGRMEWGPRALGNRSILANPCNPAAKELLNTKVKHRERFRPFAPVVCDIDASIYFDCDNPVPEPADYMLMVYPIRKEYHNKIPSVTHVDGSGRLQTIRYNQNPLYYNTIQEFGRLSGIPILINTSFNIRGEPIVCSPIDAYKCMMGTGIDVLVMDNYIIHRNKNLKDVWDSEKKAKD